MLIRVSRRSAELEETDDLRRLHVVTALDAAGTDHVLRDSGLGSVRPDGLVALDIEALRGRTATGRGDGWDERWAEMVAYAAGRGWISADGRNLIAHVETAWRSGLGGADAGRAREETGRHGAGREVQ